VWNTDDPALAVATLVVVTRPLDAAAIDAFERDGYVVLREAFDRELAAQGREYMWRIIGLSPDRPAEWRERFIHVQQVFSDGPFPSVMNTRIAGAFDQLLGAGRWRFREAYGWWPVLFPGHLARARAADLGWHVDGMHNARRIDSPEQGLVTLFIFSDIDAGDGGTALRAGSHRAVARALAGAGPDGLAAGELARRLPRLGREPVAELTGAAGDLALLHPLLIHAVNANRGRHVRFACNPHVSLRAPMHLDAPDAELSPVERAVVAAVAR
jgi:ectoine hydroxylase-related dioxygenase (phytanoyl-CoA dioxygenase family)